ncbi:hypothetical protein J5O04_06400 [Corynebacterium hindlerae]|uniref:hypothetical protein n=1 Tax=Corynebacterium hindlerae TaxID=699041 RepID=UPI001AD73D3E|nr:hypothetical protein [Corynebacterium hindlerae]QTH58499.1 hypothetical protein J5O04_06400 [Corynebacterium hindlerae]
MTMTAPGADHPNTLRPRLIPGVVGAYAEVLLISLLAFGLSGLAWGAWRPAVSGVITDSGGVEVTDPELLNANIEFHTFGVMVVCFVILGIILGCYAWLRHQDYAGIGMMLWGSVTMVLGSLTFYLAGTKLALLKVGTPAEDELQVGAHIDYLPSVGIANAVLVAPFVFVLMMWLLAVFSSYPHQEHDAERANLSS